MVEAFKTNGSSPPARRYRLKLATWTVVREPRQLSPRKLDSPTAVAELALDIVHSADDGREHFWCILLDAQLRYLMHTEVSVGTLTASLVQPREVFGPALREGACGSAAGFTGEPRPGRTPAAPAEVALVVPMR